MIAIASSLLVLLFLLDLYDLRRNATSSASAPGLGLPAVCFLAGVAAIYCALEAAAGWLAPDAETILDTSQLVLADWFRAEQGGKPSATVAWGLAVVLFYTAGFWDYLVHRVFSHSRWFWFTHEYHHLPRRVCLLMPGILGRPFAALPSVLTIGATAVTAHATMFALGLPRWDLRGMLPVLLAIAVILTASHSSFLRRLPGVHRCLRWVCITTPQEHLLHHSADCAGNYGNFTSLWDRVFGTYLDPAGMNLDTVRLGLNYDQDFLGALTWGRLKLPKAWRHRFQLSHSCSTDQPETSA